MLARTVLNAAATAALLMIVGCASPLPDVRLEADAALAAGLRAGDAIVFHSDAAPDDATDPIDAMSLADAVRLTARNSPDIQAAMARVRIAQAQARQARLLPNPVVSLALRFPENGTAIIDAGLSADLIAILRRPGTINAADSRLRVASAESLTVVLDELSAAQEHFVAIQSLEASSAILNERRGLLDRLLSLAESRLRIGEGTRLDVVTFQTQRAELEAEFADRELELRDQQLALARLIGQPSSRADWPLPKWTNPATTALDEQTLVRIGLESRPEVRQRRWELEAFGYERKLSAWNLLDGSDAGIEAERDGDWSIGPSAVLPIPLLDMGQAQRQRTMAALIEARHQLTAARRKVIEDVRRAYTNLTGTRKNLDRVSNQLLPLQEDRLKQAEAQFKAGQTDITALLIAEQDLRASQAQLIELQRRVAIAQVRLDRAIGGTGVLAAAANRSTTPPYDTED